MNLKFFILGLYVLVSIAQVKTQPNAVENAEMNAEKGALDRAKRQKKPVGDTLKRSRRFNPLQALGNLVNKPMDSVLKDAINKVMASYSDPSKPFGPTYDTTYGSPPSNRRAFTPDESNGMPMSPEEMQMSSMGQPLPGQQGYYTYSTRTGPGYYQTQTYAPQYRNFGHGLEPTLPYQANYDNYMNGKQTAFGGPPPGYFPHNPYERTENRRAGGDKMTELMNDVVMKSPEEINTLLAQIKKYMNIKDGDSVGTRKGFMEDIYDKTSSEERFSGESYSNTQAEFSSPLEDVEVGNRRFSTENPQEFHDNIDKLLTSTARGAIVLVSYVKGLLDAGDEKQIGERLLQLYDVIKGLKSTFRV